MCRITLVIFFQMSNYFVNKRDEHIKGAATTNEKKKQQQQHEKLRAAKENVTDISSFLHIFCAKGNMLNINIFRREKKHELFCSISSISRSFSFVPMSNKSKKCNALAYQLVSMLFDAISIFFSSFIHLYSTLNYVNP